MAKNAKTTGPAKAKRPKLTLVGRTAATTATKTATTTATKKKMKTAAKKTAKPATTTATKRAKGSTDKTPGSSVFWKFLEMKEAKRKEHAEQAAGMPADKGHGPGDSRANGKHAGFARYTGPRRRAAV